MARNKEVLTTGEVADLQGGARGRSPNGLIQDSCAVIASRYPRIGGFRSTQLVRFMRQNNMPLEGVVHFTKTRV